MPVAPGTSSCLAILVSSVTLMSLSVDELDDRRAGSAARLPPSAACCPSSAAAFRCRLASLAISLHSSSNPSPLAADTGSGGVPKYRSSALRFRARSARDSLSIFVATTRRRVDRAQPTRPASVSRVDRSVARRARDAAASTQQRIADAVATRAPAAARRREIRLGDRRQLLRRSPRRPAHSRSPAGRRGTAPAARAAGPPSTATR